jgi:hypothetical protein
MYVNESGEYPAVYDTDSYISSLNSMYVNESGEYRTVEGTDS